MDAAPPASSTRVRIDLAYDGSAFHGWAAQPGRRTVQGELEHALATLLARHAPAPRLTVAGRTDVGVHARRQVAHLELNDDQRRALSGRRGDEPLAALVRRLNGTAGRVGDLRVIEAAPAPAGFDARFSALWRRYEYRIADSLAAQDPRARAMTLWHPAALELDAMNDAAETLLGLHDFASFCRPREGATTIRTLQAFRWHRDDEGVLVARLQADAFCHSMVRALVGACVAAGERRLDREGIAGLRDARERTSAFKVLAAHGLTLMEVGYPADDELATRAAQTRARREAGETSELV